LIPDLPKNYRDADGALKDYTYYVVEQESGMWHVEYSTDGENYTTVASGADVHDGKTPIIIKNSTWTVSLPSTGGPGTVAIYATGAGLLILAAIWFVWDQRRKVRIIDD